MGKYFDVAGYIVVNGKIVYAKNLNDPLTALDTGLQNLVLAIQRDSLKSGDDIGTADAYHINLDPEPDAYEEDLTVWLKPANTNTGPSTLQLNNLDPVPIKRIGLNDLAANDIASGFNVQLKYSAGNFQIVSNVGTPEARAEQAAAEASGYAQDAQDWVENLGSPSSDRMFYYRLADGTGDWAFVGLGQLPSGMDNEGRIVGLETEYVDADSLKLKKGACANVDNTVPLVLASDSTKNLKTAFGSGGAYVGTAPAEGFRFVFVIRKDSDESIDWCIDSDADGANIPAGYSDFRRLAPVFFDSSVNIVRATHVGNKLTFATTFELFTGNSATNTDEDISGDVPSIVTEILVNTYGSRSAAQSGYTGDIFFSLDGGSSDAHRFRNTGTSDSKLSYHTGLWLNVESGSINYRWEENASYPQDVNVGLNALTFRR